MIYLYPIPEIPFNPKECVGKSPLFSRKVKSCKFDKQIHTKFQDKQKKMVDSVLDDLPKILRLYLDGYFCNEKDCRFTKDGKLLYNDGFHLSDGGIKYLGDKLFPELLAPALETKKALED